MKYLNDKTWWQHFGKTLKFSFYVCTHPFDGFWDLTNEKRGSLAAANLIVFLSILVEVLRLTLSNFMFVRINMEKFNAIMIFLRTLVPVLLWTLSNWSLTTLMDGKGKMRDIYMAVAYALLPSVIINALMIIISQFITFEEGAIYWFLSGLSMVWTGLLIICGMMMIHDYSMTKTLLSSFLTVIGMGIIVFIFVIFFSLISDTIAYFISLYKEILFRVI